MTVSFLRIDFKPISSATDYVLDNKWEAHEERNRKDNPVKQVEPMTRENRVMGCLHVSPTNVVRNLDLPPCRYGSRSRFC